jgi:hypothetical protein
MKTKSEPAAKSKERQKALNKLQSILSLPEFTREHQEFLIMQIFPDLKTENCAKTNSSTFLHYRLHLKECQLQEIHINFKIIT